MKKKNIVVNIVSFFAALLSLFSGIIVWLILPSGEGFRGGREGTEDNLFFGLAHHDWMDIHTVSSLIFMGLIIIHLILHWHWIKNLPRMLKE